MSVAVLTREECAAHAATLHEHPGVHRVIFASVDGVALYDDAVLDERDHGAATAASLVGMVVLAAGALGLDDPEGAVIYARERQLITRALGDRLLLVVLADAGQAGTGVYRSVKAVALAVGGR